MIDFFKKSVTWAFGVVTVVFTFAPESFFEKQKWITQDILQHCKWLSGLDTNDINITISRVLCFLLIFVVTSVTYFIYLRCNKCITIKGDNYLIQVEYGDIQKEDNECKRVINFDECFTTQVGEKTADINPSSICGQYLMKHPNLDIQKLIADANIKPAQRKSKYQKNICYDSGTIVPNGDDLLMAFAKLDEKGKGRFFSRDEYLLCLELLWKELENHYSQKDVCVPILGAGTTSFDGGAGASISQQDLLDMMIWSYKLSSHKIKSPHKLRIICKKNKGFSINNIDK